MAPFELAEPRSLSEAFSLLQDDAARPMSGGTALMLMMKAGVLRPARLGSLRRLRARAHRARCRRRASRRRDDAAAHAGKVAAPQKRLARDRADAAHAFQRARAQCRHG